MQYWKDKIPLQCFWWSHFLLKLTLFSSKNIPKNHQNHPPNHPPKCPKSYSNRILEVDYYLSFFFLLDVISTATLLSMDSRFEGLDVLKGGFPKSEHGKVQGCRFVPEKHFRKLSATDGTYRYGCFQKYGKTLESSILIGFSIISHPFWGTPILGNIHINICFQGLALIQGQIYNPESSWNHPVIIPS